MNLVYYQNQKFLTDKISKLEESVSRISEQLLERDFLLKRYLRCKTLKIPHYEEILLHNYYYSDLTISEIKLLQETTALTFVNVSLEANHSPQIKNTLHRPFNTIKKNKSLNKLKYKPLVILSNNPLESIITCELLAQKDFLCLINCSESSLKW